MPLAVGLATLSGIRAELKRTEDFSRKTAKGEVVWMDKNTSKTIWDKEGINVAA